MARHKEFDRRQALSSAVKVFWEKGFDATNLSDLTKAMGISRSSLYETFKDKESLFEESIDYYFQNVARHRLEALIGSDSVKEGFKKLFNVVLETSLSPENPGGCFIINTSLFMTTLDQRIAKRIQESVNSGHLKFVEVLKKGQISGEISKDKDIALIARVFVSTLIAITVMSRINRDRGPLEEMIKGALNILD